MTTPRGTGAFFVVRAGFRYGFGVAASGFIGVTPWMTRTGLSGRGPDSVDAAGFSLGFSAVTAGFSAGRAAGGVTAGAGAGGETAALPS
jgi:hypothetical protein